MIEAPAWIEGLLYCAARDPNGGHSRLLAIDPESRTVLWTWRNEVGTRLPPGPSPKISGDLLYTGTVERRMGILAVDRHTGQTAWYYEAGVPDGAYGLGGPCAIAASGTLNVRVCYRNGTQWFSRDSTDGGTSWGSQTSIATSTSDAQLGAAGQYVALLPAGLLLARPHRRIDARRLEQAFVIAALDDTALLHDQDLVGADHGREAVGDHQRRATARDLVEAFLDLLLGTGVEG